MPTLPQDLSSSGLANANQVIDDRRNRFKYQDLSPDLKIPGLSPAGIPLIVAEQESYWGDSAYQARDTQRRDDAKEAFLSPSIPLFPIDLDSYHGLKSAFPPVSISTNVEPSVSDNSFAGQRLSGANPLLIERVTDVAEIPNLAIQSGIGNVKFADAIDEKRLYVCNYARLTNFAGPGAILTGGSFPGAGVGVDVPVFPCSKFLHAPIALFYWEGDFNETGRLTPLGIQLEQTSAAGVFAPPAAQNSPQTSPNNWLHAKSAVQIADGHVHEWDMHLVRSHFVGGVFAMAAERNLHEEHPILILLRPHFRYLLTVNSVTDELVGHGAIGDTLLALRHDDSMQLLNQFFGDYSFVDMADPVAEIASRRMSGDVAPIPYPYRDDGLPVFSAIQKFVDRYVRLYYDNDSDVREDFQLQKFVNEVCDDDGGRLGEVTESGRQLRDIKELVRLLSRIIWVAGPFHAAVNFSQWDYMASPANMPLSGYTPLPDSGSDADAPSFISFYPQSTLAKYQASVMYTLGTYRLDMLGHYRPKDFHDPDALKAIADFQCHLARIGADTSARDNARAVSYPYLIPWNIPNSTNV